MDYLDRGDSVYGDARASQTVGVETEGGSSTQIQGTLAGSASDDLYRFQSEQIPSSFLPFSIPSSKILGQRAYFE